MEEDKQLNLNEKLKYNLVLDQSLVLHTCILDSDINVHCFDICKLWLPSSYSEDGYKFDTIFLYLCIFFSLQLLGAHHHQ